MKALNNSILVYGNFHIEAPKETPSYGINQELVHTIINNRYHLIYIWLYNNKEFWFFPIDDDGIYLDGYGWNLRRWVRVKIKINSVISYH